MAGTTRVLVAEVRLISASDGGRSSPIISGYRGMARFSDSAQLFGFQLDFDVDTLAPGQSVIGRLTFWAGDYLPEFIVGKSLELQEGAHVVAHGTVLEVLADPNRADSRGAP